MRETIIAIVLIVTVVVVYIVSYAVNKKTPIPEGCEQLTDFSACGGCTNSGCQIKPSVISEDQHVK